FRLHGVHADEPETGGRGDRVRPDRRYLQPPQGQPDRGLHYRPIRVRSSVVATTRTLFDHELAELKSGVVRMGSMVEQAIAESMRALVDRNNALAKEVIARDQEVN